MHNIKGLASCYIRSCGGTGHLSQSWNLPLLSNWSRISLPPPFALAPCIPLCTERNKWVQLTRILSLWLVRQVDSFDTFWINLTNKIAFSDKPVFRPNLFPSCTPSLRSSFLHKQLITLSALGILLLSTLFISFSLSLFFSFSLFPSFL